MSTPVPVPMNCSVADLDPGSGAFFDPWIRDPDPEWTTQIIFPSAQKQPTYLGVKKLKFFDTDPGSRMEKNYNQDPG